MVFGENNPIKKSDIGNFIDGEFDYYNGVYENIKNFGMPYKDWTCSPHWVLDLFNLFEQVGNEYQAHLIKKK